MFAHRAKNKRETNKLYKYTIYLKFYIRWETVNVLVGYATTRKVCAVLILRVLADADGNLVVLHCGL